MVKSTRSKSNSKVLFLWDTLPNMLTVGLLLVYYISYHWHLRHSVPLINNFILISAALDMGGQHMSPAKEEYLCGWGAAFINITITFPINKVGQIVFVVFNMFLLASRCNLARDF